VDWWDGGETGGERLEESHGGMIIAARMAILLREK
jgi:hypothetical protein